MTFYWPRLSYLITHHQLFQSVTCQHSLCDPTTPDSKVHGTNIRPTWVLPAPDGPHVGPMNLAIRDTTPRCNGPPMSLDGVNGCSVRPFKRSSASPCFIWEGPLEKKDLINIYLPVHTTTWSCGSLTDLTHWGLVMRMSVSKMDRHYFF